MNNRTQAIDAINNRIKAAKIIEDLKDQFCKLKCIICEKEMSNCEQAFGQFTFQCSHRSDSYNIIYWLSITIENQLEHLSFAYNKNDRLELVVNDNDEWIISYNTSSYNNWFNKMGSKKSIQEIIKAFEKYAKWFIVK